MKKLTLMSLTLAMFAAIGTDASAQNGYPLYNEDTYTVLGEGLLRDDCLTVLFGSKPRSWKVTVEESVEHPGVYRVPDAYKNSGYGEYKPSGQYDKYLYIDASNPGFVYMQNYYTGILSGYEIDPDTGDFKLDENGEHIPCQYEIGSMAGYNTLMYGWVSGRFVSIDEGSVGSINYGSITFPVGTLIARESSARETDIFSTAGLLWTPANRHGEFLLRLPGAPDTDMTVTIGDYREVSESEVWIPASFNYSLDLDKAVVMMQRGEYSKKVMEDFIAGKIEGREIYEDHATIEYPFEGSDVYTAYMIGYLGDEVVARQYATREIRIDRNWRPLDNARWVEVFISDNYLTATGYATNVVEPREYEVKLEQNIDHPGQIRLVNPYTNEAPTYYYYSDDDNVDKEHMYYIYFDLSDPERVFMRTTETGIGVSISWLGGRVRASSRAYRYTTGGGPIYVGTELNQDGVPEDKYEVRIWTPEEVAENNLYGKYDADKQVVTFPKDALCVDISANPNSWYYANSTNKFRLTLPRDFDGVETVIAEGAVEADAPVVYYNLQGMPVANPEKGKIYIMVKGNKSSKIRF